MKDFGMNVAELIEHLRSLPPGHQVCIATRYGNEEISKENMLHKASSCMVLLTPTDQHGNPWPENSNNAGDRCDYADTCMHFAQATDSTAHRVDPRRSCYAQTKSQVYGTATERH